MHMPRLLAWLHPEWRGLCTPSSNSRTHAAAVQQLAVVQAPALECSIQVNSKSPQPRMHLLRKGIQSGTVDVTTYNNVL